MNLSMSFASTMVAASSSAPRYPSLRPAVSTEKLDRVLTLYKGISDRPLGWKKNKRYSYHPALGANPKEMDISRWDGAARTSRAWDALRRDPELYNPRGDCLIYLYAQGQSSRGPAFQLPMETLLAAHCHPLLQRILSQHPSTSPRSDSSSGDEAQHFSQPLSDTYQLYVPAPPSTDRRQAFLYHIATRNFFAWMCGRPLVGPHLGAALVGLLHSMSEFRSPEADNVQAILDYMDEEGYADMRNQPTHALAILFFAEHFHFRDLYLDAFSHCAGMNDKLYNNPGFEAISRASRALITRARLEMDMRLDDCGRRLSSFLLEDLSEAHLGLSASARGHMDKFRSFLQSYYVRTLGYYPPTSVDAHSAAFPKNIYGQMRTEFQKLYDYLVDSHFSPSDSIPSNAQGGLCVFQSTKAFDTRHRYTPLAHPLPLLPEINENSGRRQGLSKRMSWVGKADKMKQDPRLSTLTALVKATNSCDRSLSDCNLVRAYKQFEKDCVVSPGVGDKSPKGESLPQTDARKVRWILIYGMLQTLNSATKVPGEVRDSQNVHYNLCVLTGGCPPWKDERPSSALLRSQSDHAGHDLHSLGHEIKPDVDYYALNHRPQPVHSNTAPALTTFPPKKGTVSKARSALGNMPELVHPRPQRNAHHEILVYGYGNGLNHVTIASKAQPEQDEPISVGHPPPSEERQRKMSADSGTSSLEERTSRWSHSTINSVGVLDSPTTSYSAHSRRGSDASVTSKNDIKQFLDSPTNSLGFLQSSKLDVEFEVEALQPNPLRVRNKSV